DLHSFPTRRSSDLRADAEAALADAIERFVDQHQHAALSVGEREVQLFGVSARGFVGEILDAVVGLRVAGGLVALVGVDELLLLLAKRVFVDLIRTGFRFRSGHLRASSPYL